MPTNFSPVGEIVDLSVVNLDKAPSAPIYVDRPAQNGASISGSLQCVNADFDGSPLTGLNNAYVCAAFRLDDGTSQLESLSPQAMIDAGFLKVKMDVTPANAANGDVIPFSFPQTPNSNGNQLQVAIFSSDETA